MHASSAAKEPVALTRNQWRGFWASWGGWTLDGMDSFIYALVMVPAMRELLPRSGLPANAANQGFYGSLLFALFLVGWGLAFLWGPVADKFGRVRTLMLTILCYSAFTFAGAFAGGIWQLAGFRFLAGIGIGGEWAMGGTFVAEEWPEKRRAWGAGLMHTGYYVGVLLAAVANYTVGSRWGWRAMFALGGTPAVLVAFIRHGVREPGRWQRKAEKMSALAWARPLAMLFSAELRRRTILNCVFVLVSIVGLWAGSVYLPAWTTHLASQAGASVPDAARWASLATLLLSVATILGCILVPPMAERVGRRATLACFFFIMMLSILMVFGWEQWRGLSTPWLVVWLFLLGIGGASFGVYTLWLPEQYPTECRASAFALATSVGRFAGAGITFLVGVGVARYGNIGTPVAITAAAFAVGLLLVPFGEETRGRGLPQ